MILDKTLIFCENKSLATGVSDVVNITKGGDAILHELTLVGVTPVAAAGGTKIVVALETSDTEAFTAYDTIFTSPDIVTAQMKAGSKVVATRMPRGAKCYLRMRITATGTFTGGTISLFMVTGDQHGYKEIGG